MSLLEGQVLTFQSAPVHLISWPLRNWTTNGSHVTGRGDRTHSMENTRGNSAKAPLGGRVIRPVTIP